MVSYQGDILETILEYQKDYELSNKIVKVEINDKGIFVDDTQVEETENTIEFTFENKICKNLKIK